MKTMNNKGLNNKRLSYELIRAMIEINKREQREHHKHVTMLHVNDEIDNHTGPGSTVDLKIDYDKIIAELEKDTTSD